MTASSDSYEGEGRELLCVLMADGEGKMEWQHPQRMLIELDRVFRLTIFAANHAIRVPSFPLPPPFIPRVLPWRVGSHQ